jgi:transcriptional regulator with XRE-family HTH domain
VIHEVPSIGDVVRQWRTFRKLNLTEFAKKAGLSKGYVSGLENNKIENPTPPNLEKLANGIEISVLELLARRLPGNSAEETASASTAPALDDTGDFTFASPLRTAQRGSKDKEQLRQILAHVDELRAMIMTLIAEQG